MTSAHQSYDVRIFGKECTSLANAGYEVFLVARGQSREENGVHVIGIGDAPVNRAKRFFSFSKKIYKEALNLDCDVYHFHDPELLPFALKLKRKGKIVIFDSHECYPMQIRYKEYLPKWLAKCIASLYFPYETFVVKRIDGVVVCCETEEKYSFLPRAKHVAFVNNYPNLADVQVSGKLMQGFEKRNICYSGSLSYGRGIKHITEAAEKANVNLCLAGAFSPEGFEKEIINDSTSGFVHFSGYLNKTQLREFYSNCAVGMCTLLPVGQYDKTNNLSTKAYEYMGMGMPMIISDFPYNRSFMEKYKVGLLADPLDVGDIAEKIHYMFSNVDAAVEMGKCGREAFEREFNWSVAEKELLNLYSSVMNII